MEILSKIVRGIASIPLIGGALVFVLAFLPLLAVVPLNLSNGLSMIIGGLLMAAWCYFLKAKNIINIVTPFIPFPLWIFAVIMAIAGVYGMITNAWDDSKIDAERVPQEITPSKRFPTPAPKPEPEPVSIPEADPVEFNNAEKIQEANSIDFNKMKDEAAENALKEMQKALKDLEELSESIGQEKLDEIINAQGSSDNSMNFEETMAEMRKQIAELKSQGYGAN